MEFLRALVKLGFHGKRHKIREELRESQALQTLKDAGL
jgi:hypothetical protein